MGRHRMSAVDAAWLRMDSPENLMVVTSAQWYDKPLDRAKVAALLEERMIDLFPRFSQRAIDDHGLWWEDVEDFDVNDRLHDLVLPEPAGRAELEKVVGDQVSVPLSWDQPLWDIYLIDRYEGGGAAIFRMHHAIADGFSLVRVLLSLTDDPDVEPANIAPAIEDEAGWVALAGDAVRGALSLATHPMVTSKKVLGLANPMSLVDLGHTVVSDTAAIGKLLLLPPDHHTVLKGPLGHEKRTAWTDPFSFDDVKNSAHASGATINDLLLAAVAGALRTYLVRRRSVVADVRAIVPFNLRPLDKPLPANLGNQFGLVYLALPVGTATHQERLAHMKQRMDAIKKSAEGVVAFGILEILGKAPGAVEDLAIKIFTSKGTGVMTNVPGPRHPVTLAGSRLLGTIGWGPTSGDLGLGVAIFSYADEITVGFCVDKGLIPDVEVLRADFMDELSTLLNH
ncbi:wax ester/triacylglycerol synthase family O-acyltransferase [Nocardioides sp.]|uniref:wax ester/triacylglycerol synthase family O-acyltransferase n=1 Tax=Nocardioides sp. TaxID=35761 RepID=UPI0035617E3C